MAGQSSRATLRIERRRPSRHAITARNSTEAITIRIPLRPGPGSSRSAAFSTLKLLPQKKVMRSSHASRRVKRSFNASSVAFGERRKRTPRRSRPSGSTGVLKGGSGPSPADYALNGLRNSRISEMSST